MFELYIYDPYVMYGPFVTDASRDLMQFGIHVNANPHTNNRVSWYHCQHTHSLASCCAWFVDMCRLHSMHVISINPEIIDGKRLLHVEVTAHSKVYVCLIYRDRVKLDGKHIFCNWKRKKHHCTPKVLAEGGLMLPALAFAMVTHQRLGLGSMWSGLSKDLHIMISEAIRPEIPSNESVITVQYSTKLVWFFFLKGCWETPRGMGGCISTTQPK